MSKEIVVSYEPYRSGKIALITLTRPGSLNALTSALYVSLGVLLQGIAADPDVILTVITGTGKFFSAGADIKAGRSVPEGAAVRQFYIERLSVGNLDLARTFFHHPHPLIAALNGPVIGLTAALIACCDFIYAADTAWLLTPFASLGLAPEGGASQMFVRRMGLSMANRALITGERLTAEALLASGFVDKVFPSGPSFMDSVMAYIRERFQDPNVESMKIAKKMIRSDFADAFDKSNVQEVFEGVDRFVTGVPQQQFQDLASGKKKHKL